MTDLGECGTRLARLPRWVRVADYLTFGLVALTVFITLFGGIHVEPFGLRLSISTPMRLLTEAAVIAALRHWRYRQPTARAHAEFHYARLRLRAPYLFPSTWPRAILVALAITIATRLTVLIVGYMAVQTLGYSLNSMPEWRVSPSELQNLPARWDSGWYLQIAQKGYEWNAASHGQQSLIFFPAFPMVTRGVTWAIWRDVSSTVNLLWGGVVVSLLAFPLAIAYLYNLAREQVGDGAALGAVAALAAYPFALFYSAAYTESLYLLAVVALFYHFTRGQLWWASAWGLLAGLTRPNGWMASASLALIVLPALMSRVRLNSARQWLGRWLPEFRESPVSSRLQHARLPMLLVAVCAPGVGLLIFCAYVYHLTGDPLAWAHLMTYWGRDFNGLSLISSDLDRLRAVGFVDFMGSEPINLLNGLALVFGLLSVWPVSRRLGLAYGLFVLVNVALPATSGGLVSIGRYSAVLFPSFIWLSSITPAFARPAVIAFFAIGQGLATVLFFTWRAVY